jgi:hypothetical protein
LDNYPDNLPTGECVVANGTPRSPACYNDANFDCVIGTDIYDCYCCPPAERDPLSPRCTVDGVEGISSAIGCIPVSNSNALVSFVLRWAFGVGGGIALLLIIYSGFQIITSGGNPQQIQSGKELLTAAFSGLLLMIFAVFILELIGVRILGLPGF